MRKHIHYLNSCCNSALDNNLRLTIDQHTLNFLFWAIMVKCREFQTSDLESFSLDLYQNLFSNSWNRFFTNNCYLSVDDPLKSSTEPSLPMDSHCLELPVIKYSTLDQQLLWFDSNVLNLNRNLTTDQPHQSSRPYRHFHHQSLMTHYIDT
jgi:hypothetical protein